MKIKVPAKVVEVCDICTRQAPFFTVCVVCQKRYCSTCEAIIGGCVHQPEVCKKCAEDELVTAAVKRFVKPLVDILDRRDKALAALRKLVLRKRKQAK